jgi:hypothetical protein
MHDDCRSSLQREAALALVSSALSASGVAFDRSAAAAAMERPFAVER